jgi:hypothetical protein
MNRTAYILMSCVVVATVGCRGPSLIRSGPPSVLLSGIVAESKSVPGRFALADFGRSRYDRALIVRPVGPHKNFETHQAMKIKIQQQSASAHHDYMVILGADLDPLNTEPAAGKLLNSEPRFYLETGWALMSGSAIRLESTWVRGGAEGTTIVVEVVDETMQRVYLLKENIASAYIELTCKDVTGPPDRIDYGENGRYVEIDANCMISAPMDIDGDPVAEPFIDTLKKIAEAAGWIAPP